MQVRLHYGKPRFVKLSIGEHKEIIIYSGRTVSIEIPELTDKIKKYLNENGVEYSTDTKPKAVGLKDVAEVIKEAEKEAEENGEVPEMIKEVEETNKELKEKSSIDPENIKSITNLDSPESENADMVEVAPKPENKDATEVVSESGNEDATETGTSPQNPEAVETAPEEVVVPTETVQVEPAGEPIEVEKPTKPEAREADIKPEIPKKPSKPRRPRKKK